MPRSWSFKHPRSGISHFIVPDRNTDYLLPPSVDDWLNHDHLARFIVG